MSFAGVALQTLLEEILLYLERSAAASTGRGDSLSVAWISDVASSKNAIDTGERSTLSGYDIACRIELQLPCKEVGIGLMSDS